MSIKRTFISYGILIAVGVTLYSFAINNNAHENQEAPAKIALHPLDNRISLELSSEIKVRQLTKMQSHFKSIQSIVRLITEEQFIEAATIAKTKLVGGGCKQKLSSFINNESFKLMGGLPSH
jgi:Ethanolamine utilization protein EutJ (predicted chaperonin)